MEKLEEQYNKHLYTKNYQLLTITTLSLLFTLDLHIHVHTHT